MPTVSLYYSRGIYISCVLDISEDGDEDGDVINNELRAGAYAAPKSAMCDGECEASHAQTITVALLPYIYTYIYGLYLGLLLF